MSDRQLHAPLHSVRSHDVSYPIHDVLPATSGTTWYLISIFIQYLVLLQAAVSWWETLSSAISFSCSCTTAMRYSVACSTFENDDNLYCGLDHNQWSTCNLSDFVVPMKALHGTGGDVHLWCHNVMQLQVSIWVWCTVKSTRINALWAHVGSISRSLPHTKWGNKTDTMAFLD